MIRRFIVLAVLVCLWVRPGAGAEPIEQEAAQIVDQFYDLQFDAAIASAKRLVAEHPDHPAGYFFESVAYFQRYLLEDPDPQNAYFTSFLALNKESLDKAIHYAGVSQSVSHYYQGAALGFQARAYVSQKKYMLAVPRARQGVSHLKKALELDPSLEDANLGLGMYYYFSDRMPAAAKPLAVFLIGMKGDRQKGLGLLHRTADQGSAAREEAKSVLAAIDASEAEQQWDSALPLFQELLRRYPHNPRYRLGLAYVLQRKGLWDLSLKTIDSDGLWLQGVDPAWHAKAQMLAWYRSAEDLLFAGRYAEAGVLLDRLEAGPHVKRLSDWVSLRRGNYWDALGQPAKAKVFYAEVQHKKAKALADAFSRMPFPAGPRDVMPNHWPVSTLPE